MSPESQGSLSYRMAQLEHTIKDQNVKLDAQAKQLARLEPLAGEVRGLRRAAYWIAGLIVASSVGFAFSVLALIG